MTGFLASIGYGQWALHALILLPLIGIIPVLLVPVAAAKRVALVITVAEFVISLGLWWAWQPAAGMQLVTSLPWIPRLGVSYAVGLDGISLFMVLLSTGLMPLAVLSSYTYITKYERPYYALLLAQAVGMIGCFIATDLFLFYVFFELLLIPMYFLIGIWGGANRLYAAIKFFVYTMLGSLLMLVAILVMVWKVAAVTGQLSFSYTTLLANAGAVGGAAPWLFAAFALAFAIKVPIFPLHTWLPDAHVEAPTAGSVLLASVLLKVGTYGFLRFAVPFFPSVALSPTVTALMVTLAVVGIIYGALVALVQPDFKKLVAYSSVSHLGFVMLGIWSGTVQGVQGALMVMISHGLSTGALFFLIGMMYERRHTRDIAAYGGIARVVPVFGILLTVVALSSIGLPGLNGFVGEFLVLLGSFGSHPGATTIATTGVIFAAAYLLWAIQRILFNRLDRPENEGMLDLNPRELVVLIPLVAGIVWLGLYPGPVLRRMEPSARQFVETTAAGHAAGAMAEAGQ
ncbi:MAG TPA: NADH-quinone oxidoreductase subunit M [Gemmatimonadales bacterium]|jgi:NADH-quinone oxidoreductase subunit M|nr:NADH-quinone oxidoreductase subunit M [Gemmatimonadales bacterium]